MNEQKTVLVINAIIDKENATALPGYLSEVMQIFGSHGGKPLARLKTTDQLLGENSPEMVAIITFPDAETIKAMIGSEAFQALSQTREKVFSKLNMVICDTM